MVSMPSSHANSAMGKTSIRAFGTLSPIRGSARLLGISADDQEPKVLCFLIPYGGKVDIVATMTIADKKYWGQWDRTRQLEKCRRTGLYAFVGLVVVVLDTLVFTAWGPPRIRMR